MKLNFTLQQKELILLYVKIFGCIYMEIDGVKVEIPK